MGVSALELTEEQAAQLLTAQVKFMQADEELFEYTTQFDLERPSGPPIAQMLWDWAEARNELLRLRESFIADKKEVQ